MDMKSKSIEAIRNGYFLPDDRIFPIMLSEAAKYADELADDLEMEMNSSQDVVNNAETIYGTAYNNGYNDAAKDHLDWYVTSRLGGRIHIGDMVATSDGDTYKVTGFDFSKPPLVYVLGENRKKRLDNVALASEDPDTWEKLEKWLESSFEKAVMNSHRGAYSTHPKEYHELAVRAVERAKKLANETK